MSDDEFETTSNCSKTSKGDEKFAKKKQGVQKNELNNQLKEYINEWRKTREKEEDELQKMKEKQSKRKEIRKEQEMKMAQQKKEEEEKVKQEEAEKRAVELEEKKKRLAEAEAKRQEMLAVQKARKEAEKEEKRKAAAAASAGGPPDAKREMSKTKEQLEEEKSIALSIRVKPINIDGMDSDELRDKASEIYNICVQLETDKYDLTEKLKTQEYEMMELKERQKMQLRQRAVKKGLDPDALIGKYPPKIRMYSKYERRMDTRTYADRKHLYEGGWEVLRSEHLDSLWKDRYEEWNKRTKARLPKWFGERPGAKPGEVSPEDGEGPLAEEIPEEEEEEEEEEEYEEEEE